MGGKSKGPSQADLAMQQFAAEQRAKAERDRLTQESERNRQLEDAKFSEEKANNAAIINQMKTASELEQNRYKEERAADQAKEEARLLEVANQKTLQENLDKESARNASEENSKQLAIRLAQKQKLTPEIWYADNDDANDVANETVAEKRRKASKAKAASVEALWQ